MLDVAVFGFQLSQYPRINENSNLANCWSRVLDDAITHPITKTEHAELLTEARRCVRLYGRPK